MISDINRKEEKRKIEKKRGREKERLLKSYKRKELRRSDF